jgi:hypothetical protein
MQHLQGIHTYGEEVWHSRLLGPQGQPWARIISLLGFQSLKCLTLWAHAWTNIAQVLLLDQKLTAASSKTCQLLCARKDNIGRAITISYTCYSLCLTIFGLAPSWPLFLDALIRTPWLTLNPSMAMHFLIRSLKGPRDISLKQGGANPILTDHASKLACWQTREPPLWLPSYRVAFDGS